jgi:hypothetical protein
VCVYKDKVDDSIFMYAIFSPRNFHLHTQVEALWSRLRFLKDLKEK